MCVCVCGGGDLGSGYSTTLGPTGQAQLFDWLICCRRRSLQFHYASSKCQRIKCPKQKEEEETNMQEKTVPEQDSRPHYFDCDPSCEETKYYYYEKGELLVTGRDFGEGYI